MMKFEPLILLIIMFMFPLILLGDEVKVGSEEEPNNVTEINIEEEVIKYLDLLKDYYLVENLTEYQNLLEIIEYEEE
ncbi:MAG: hypothetical protein N2746_04390 [Deltaproteobacteria bacterium]|nr:hypothetical protein [Deltaproteobacteria bacterium]